METALLFMVLAITVEAIVEYARTIVEHKDSKTLCLQLGALVAAILLCVAAGADVYAMLGVQFVGIPLLGCVLTGIFASRGANYASDLLSRLQKGIG